MAPLVRVLRVVAHVVGITWHLFVLNVTEADRTLSFSILRYWKMAIGYPNSLLIVTSNQSCSI